ncbi:hypothetical protein F2Q68_00004159 [Brassica cretica]|uniref:Uncharacterized protein n=1 Tax=Brassica cretica TaxID=69181 RepID=A0A8S9J4H2_BRACR|nr:hypothetical protein F2Q68_00004159 [Brassica cretica]
MFSSHRPRNLHCGALTILSFLHPRCRRSRLPSRIPIAFPTRSIRKRDGSGQDREIPVVLQVPAGSPEGGAGVSSPVSLRPSFRARN